MCQATYHLGDWSCWGLGEQDVPSESLHLRGREGGELSHQVLVQHWSRAASRATGALALLGCLVWEPSMFSKQGESYQAEGRRCLQLVALAGEVGADRLLARH